MVGKHAYLVLNHMGLITCHVSRIEARKQDEEERQFGLGEQVH